MSILCKGFIESLDPSFGIRRLDIHLGQQIFHRAEEIFSRRSKVLGMKTQTDDINAISYLWKSIPCRVEQETLGRITLLVELSQAQLKVGLPKKGSGQLCAVLHSTWLCAKRFVFIFASQFRMVKLRVFIHLTVDSLNILEYTPLRIACIDHITAGHKGVYRCHSALSPIRIPTRGNNNKLD